MTRAAWIALGAVACSDPSAPGVGRVQIALTGTRDTVRFEVPVVAAPCGRGAGLLLHGELGGQGLLIWLRSAGRPDTGTYPLLTRGDTTAPRGAFASLRYMVGDVAHAVLLDDGAAMVVRSVPRLELQIRGHGLETAMASVAGQRSAELDLEHVTLAPDTASCHVLQ